MREFAQDQRMALVVLNPQRLKLGSMPRHTFSQDGGFIGSGAVTWPLIDGKNQVFAYHCQVIWEDGGFCLIDRCGHTRVNGNPDALGTEVSVQLREGDRIHVGPFEIAVHLEHGEHSLPDPGRHLAEHSVDELLSTQQAALDDLPALDAGHPEGRLPEHASALQALMRPLENTLLDPLEAMDAVNASHTPEHIDALLDPTHYGMSSELTPPDLAHTRFEAVSGSPRHFLGETRMSSQDTSLTPSDSRANIPHSDHTDPTQMVAALLDGLGAPVGELDQQSCYRLLYEAGQTLGALIRGMLILHADQAPDQGRIGLQGRTLQPIEDNPLRLGLDYSATVSALFSNQRSLVHLSPKAAVEESLTQIQQHQRAVVQGIAAGLDALLQAFDPTQLLARFQRYQPDQTGASTQTDWAWKMYTHYFNELRSDRQRGFDKLFWEVFDQHYDRALRAEAR